MGSTAYQEAVGKRLRALRAQRGWSLADAENASGGTWAAVVIGSYERGDRALSVQKLSDLARFYGVRVADLLPEESAGGMISADVIRMTRLVMDSGVTGSVQAQRTARFLLDAGCRLPRFMKAGAA